jgi:hypothetical protein
MLESFIFSFLAKERKKRKIRIEKCSKLLNQQLEKQTQTKRREIKITLICSYLFFQVSKTKTCKEKGKCGSTS